MIFGILLLTEDNEYIDDRKQLPHRPTFDKELLKALISTNTISKDALGLLPKSLRDVAVVTHKEPSLALTIKEIDGLADILMIIRSTRKARNGKKFRLTNFSRVAAPGIIEIWHRKKEIK